METEKNELVNEPIGRIMSNIGHSSLSLINSYLSNLDINRSFYPLPIIASGNGLMTQQELAKKLNCDKVQVVRIINYLSSKGFVKRMKDKQDQRKINLVLTEKALKCLPDIRNAIQEVSELTLKNIPLQKIEELYAMLNTIKNNLDTIKNNR